MNVLKKNEIMLAVLQEHYLRSGLIYNTKNILFSKIKSLYAQHDIDAGSVMACQLYKNKGLFFRCFGGN